MMIHSPEQAKVLFDRLNHSRCADDGRTKRQREISEAKIKRRHEVKRMYPELIGMGWSQNEAKEKLMKYFSVTRSVINMDLRISA